MKLELKHLAPYLPYELKGLVEWIHKNKTHCVKLYGILENNLQIENPYGGFDYCDIEDFKPILRPLSDLTKEIEVNAEKFVPIIQTDIDIPFTSDLYFLVAYGDVQKLLEWHFDVFGLIEKGLAIDINTLNH